VDKSFLLSVISNHPELLQGKAIQTQYAEAITSEVSSKSYSIEFETGSANIKTGSYQLLNEIFESAVVAEGLKIGVYGHTDNSGSDAVNTPLSEQRADAVKAYLQKKGLPSNRIEAKGFGSSKPIADNTTAVGKSKNRQGGNCVGRVSSWMELVSAPSFLFSIVLSMPPQPAEMHPFPFTIDH
jgi:outer membrane protein OmpA-like peptidoglycan-associated protein